MGQDDPQLLYSVFDKHLVVAHRVGDMVDVVHRKAAGNSIRIPSPPVLERRVEGEDGQLLLLLRAIGRQIFLRDFASVAFLSHVLYRGMDIADLLRVGRFPKELADAMFG